MPKIVQNIKAVLNIKTNDEYCFLWCVVAALNQWSVSPLSPSSYRYLIAVLKYDNFDFSIKLKVISKFEEMHNISTYVFRTDKKQVVPICLSQFDYLTTVNHLMLSHSDTKHSEFDNLDPNNTTTEQREDSIII